MLRLTASVLIALIGLSSLLTPPAHAQDSSRDAAPTRQDAADLSATLQAVIAHELGSAVADQLRSHTQPDPIWIVMQGDGAAFPQDRDPRRVLERRLRQYMRDGSLTREQAAVFRAWGQVETEADYLAVQAMASEADPLGGVEIVDVMTVVKGVLDDLTSEMGIGDGWQGPTDADGNPTTPENPLDSGRDGAPAGIRWAKVAGVAAAAMIGAALTPGATAVGVLVAGLVSGASELLKQIIKLKGKGVPSSGNSEGGVERDADGTPIEPGREEPAETEAPTGSSGGDGGGG
ncbi:MAG: hypothetical protein AAF791_02910 [Bacteroidota bacterium]